MESNIIKALPSLYNGVWFKSRLEARWAYYFDLLGVKWEYEPEGFGLKSGAYCPDFLLENRCWAEVKPEVFEFTDFTQKFSQLVQGTQTHLVVLNGLPNARRWYYIYAWADEDECRLIDEGRHAWFCERLYGIDCPNVACGDFVQINTYSVRKNGLLWWSYGQIDDSCSDYDESSIDTAKKASRLQFDRQGRAQTWQS
jgi:hypothetical protein